MVTKNIIITQIADFRNTESKSVRGLVSFFGSGNMTGLLKVFNIPDDITPVCLAVKIGDKKYIYTDVDDPQNYSFKMVNAPASDSITVLLAYVKNNVVQGIACGQNAGGTMAYSDLFSEISDAELDNLISNEADFNELKEMSENAVLSSAGCSNLSNNSSFNYISNAGANAEQANKPAKFSNRNAEYKSDGSAENLYNSAEHGNGSAEYKGNGSAENLYNSAEKSSESAEQSGNFYSLIQPQLDELFSRFPHFKELEDLVENTEWVRVSYSDDGSQHYILGKLFDGAEVTHLCYGIPAPSRSTAPPNSLMDYCQWLPLNLDDPNGAGYWVMYQNAETGENVRL